MAEFEDDVTLTQETLDADVPDGFTIKGKVFEVEVETVFWNDEDVPASFHLLTSEGDPIAFGLDNEYFPARPSLAEALWAAMQEQTFEHVDVLHKSRFTLQELKLIYESLIRKAESLRSRELSYTMQFERAILVFKDSLSELPKDHVAELEARLKVT